MTNLEENKDEILKKINIDGCTLGCAVCLTMNHIEEKVFRVCYECNYEKLIDWMFEEYKPIKLKRWEYDLIRTNDMSHNRAFESFNTYMNMKRIGHFAGIKNTSITLEDILNNCEVIDD